MEKKRDNLKKSKRGETTTACINKLTKNIRHQADEYYLASMFPNEDVMHRVYSIIRDLQ